jgi:type III secretion system FlhB-like substrate exporter
MTERRPFPPSPRRLALARQAGLTAASPLLVGALAAAAAIVASVMLARATASLVARAIASACQAAALPADVLRAAGARSETATAFDGSRANESPVSGERATGAGAPTTGDALTTDADALTTGADALPTGDDALTTGADALTTAADALTIADDPLAIAADPLTTRADALTTGADALTTGADALTTGVDPLTIAADAPTTGADALTTEGPVAPMSIEDAAPLVLELVAPLLAAIALVAFIVHVAQTRAVWLPRRRVPGAPALAPARTRHATFEIAGASIVGLVALGWLWTTAPRLAGLFALPLAGEPASADAAGPLGSILERGASFAPTFDRLASSPIVVAVGSAIASFAAAVAIAWLALAVLDALARHFELAHALAMTTAEKREDDRLAAVDPRWRARRLELARGPSAREAVARSTLLLLGDDVAVAIAYDARRQPVPLRTITGRRALATQLIGLARRHRIAVHRDPGLAAALADGEGPVPDTHWPRLAEILAAVQRTHP